MKLIGLCAGLILTLGACGGDPLSIHGFIETTGTSVECVPGGDNPISEKTLTVRNQSGDVIGTTLTGEPEVEQTRFENVCKIRSDYSVEVEEATFYEIELEGMGEGTEPIPFEELEEEDFRYDLILNDRF